MLVTNLPQNASVWSVKYIVKENVKGCCIEKKASCTPYGCCTSILCRWQFPDMSLCLSWLSWCIFFCICHHTSVWLWRLTLKIIPACPETPVFHHVWVFFYTWSSKLSERSDGNKGIFEMYRVLIKKKKRKKPRSLFLWFLRVSVDAVQVWQWWCLGALRKEACGIGSAPRQTAGQIHP